MVQIVRKVQEAPHECLVLLPFLLGHLVAVGDVPKSDVPALRASRYDDRILDHLGVHEPEDLGAEIVGSVAVADPATGDPRAPRKVDTLHPGGPHPHPVEEPSYGPRSRRALADILKEM